MWADNLTKDDISQIEYIVYEKRSCDRWKAVEGYFYELFLPHIQGQPTVYSSRVGRTKESISFEASKHINSLQEMIKPKTYSGLIYSNK